VIETHGILAQGFSESASVPAALAATKRGDGVAWIGGEDVSPVELEDYFNLSQDEANRLMSAQSDITRKMSGYALLIAIPTIVFSLYGTNFTHVPLIGENWGYGVMLALTVVLCLVAWRKLRAADWL
jgi:hypothetical protein